MEFYNKSLGREKINLDIDNIKVVVTDTQYYYNKNNVTCEAEFEVKLPKALEKLIGWIEGNCKATAFCAPKDTYNQRTGEKIALAKVESRIYEGVVVELNKRIERIKETLNVSSPVITNFNIKAVGAIHHNEEYIKRIS